MLSAPDRGLADRHPLLPGLRLVFDSDALAAKARLQGLMLPDGCAPSYVRFKAGTRCLVGYGEARCGGPPLFYASAFASGSAKLVKAMKRPVAHSDRGPGRIVLGDEAVEVCVFPNDDHLHVLIPLADPVSRGGILAGLLPDGGWDGGTEAKTLAYKPERRCVIKFTSANGSVGLIKAYEENGFDPALANARQFCDTSESIGRQRLLGVDARRRLIAMSWLPGRSLAEQLRVPVPAMDHVEKSGALLAGLHHPPHDGLPAWSEVAATARLIEIVGGLDVLCPDEAARARALAQRVSESLATDHGATVTLHGDFHPRQVLIDGEAMSLIDFDEAMSGPAAVDVGTFISRLHMNAIRHEISESVASDGAEALLAGYSRTCLAPSQRSVRAFTALALLNVVHEPFRQHRAEWPAEISAVLDRVGRVMDSAA